MLLRTVDIDLVVEIVLEPAGIVAAVAVAAADFVAALAAADRIAAVPFVRIDCRPVDLDIVGLRLREK